VLFGNFVLPFLWGRHMRVRRPTSRSAVFFA
jgi:hypothetical protein